MTATKKQQQNAAIKSQKDAIKALRLVAEYIRAGQALPMGVDDWFAGAIETAINKPKLYAPAKGDIGHALLVRLGLESNNRRKHKVD